MKKHHMSHMDGHRGHEHAHGQYENEVEKPMVPKQGKMLAGMGVHDMKAEAQDIAYGQAGMGGCKSDASKINSQFKNYGWSDGASGY